MLLMLISHVTAQLLTCISLQLVCGEVPILSAAASHYTPSDSLFLFAADVVVKFTGLLWAD